MLAFSTLKLMMNQHNHGVVTYLYGGDLGSLCQFQYDL